MRDRAVRERTLVKVQRLAHEGAMTQQTYTLMAVHAHPDDEASSTGGLLRLAAEHQRCTSRTYMHVLLIFPHSPGLSGRSMSLRW